MKKYMILVYKNQNYCKALGFHFSPRDDMFYINVNDITIHAEKHKELRKQGVLLTKQMVRTFKWYLKHFKWYIKHHAVDDVHLPKNVTRLNLRNIDEIMFKYHFYMTTTYQTQKRSSYNNNGYDTFNLDYKDFHLQQHGKHIKPLTHHASDKLKQAMKSTVPDKELLKEVANSRMPEGKLKDIILGQIDNRKSFNTNDDYEMKILYLHLIRAIVDNITQYITSLQHSVHWSGHDYSYYKFNSVQAQVIKAYLANLQLILNEFKSEDVFVNDCSIITDRAIHVIDNYPSLKHKYLKKFKISADDLFYASHAYYQSSKHDRHVSTISARINNRLFRLAKIITADMTNIKEITNVPYLFFNHKHFAENKKWI